MFLKRLYFNVSIWLEFALLVGLGLTAPSPTRAECTYGWKPDNGMPGLNGQVRTMTLWDPDGPGPQTDVLVVGGDFTQAGNVLANHIAIWNSAAWSALGTGTNGSVSALAVYNGSLIAAGSFATAGGNNANNIAAWDGNFWSALGTGTGGSSPEVRALTTYNGNLIVGGWFATAGDITVNGIAQWNGTSWSALGGGMAPGYPYAPLVCALTVYNGKLIAGGAFGSAGGVNANEVAQWDGTSWSALGAGVNMNAPNPFVTSLVVYNGNLIAGGTFGGFITQWNGTVWSYLDGEVGNSNCPPCGGAYALTVYNGYLIAGGSFTVAGGASANYIAKWNGTAWSGLGTGMSGPSYPNPYVSALAVYNGNLIAGGRFTTAGGANSTSYIAQWRTAWSALGTAMNDTVKALTVYNGNLVAGGNFTTAGDTSASKIANWNGTSWSALGSGICCSGNPNEEIDALTVFNGNLVVGGSFLSAGGVNGTNWLAKWNGTNWSMVATNGSGRPFSTVLSLATYNNMLIVGGRFASGSRSHILASDGTIWVTLATGTNGDVMALTVYNGQLIAGGEFITAGGMSANYIAAWNGTSWSALGEGMNGYVRALAVYGGSLIAGGDFTTAGTSNANLVAQWNGTSWSALGGGMGGTSPSVTALTVYNGYLIAGGDFSTADGAPAISMAQWDGTTWSAMGTGTGKVHALTRYKNDLISGGTFAPAGYYATAYWARWGSLGSDSDSDNVSDDCDGCPNDPNKTAPGECGCGMPEGTCVSVTAWRSVRDHNGTPLGIPLDPSATGNGSTGPTVESRSGGILRIEIDLDGPALLANPGAVTVTDGMNRYIPSGVSVTNSTLAISFDPGVLPDLKCYTITLGSGLLDKSIVGSNSCKIRSLVGDSIGDGIINLSDALYIQTQAGISLLAADAPRCDINLSGDITNTDALTAKASVTSPPVMTTCP